LPPCRSAKKKSRTIVATPSYLCDKAVPFFEQCPLADVLGQRQRNRIGHARFIEPVKVSK